MKNYYKILNVSSQADIQQIKQAYRNLATKFHPDKSKDPSTAKIFIEITEAYEVLKDPFKRKQYDLLFATDNTKQEKEWQAQGETKATEYASMPYKEFKMTVLDEVKLFIKYLPLFIYAFFCFGGAVFSVYGMIKGSDSGLLGMICCLIFGYVVYSDTVRDYKTEKHKTN